MSLAVGLAVVPRLYKDCGALTERLNPHPGQLASRQ